MEPKYFPVLVFLMVLYKNNANGNTHQLLLKLEIMFLT